MLAVVWHWWIGFFLAIGALATVIAVIVGYLNLVEAKRYSKKS